MPYRQNVTRRGKVGWRQMPANKPMSDAMRKRVARVIQLWDDATASVPHAPMGTPSLRKGKTDEAKP